MINKYIVKDILNNCLNWDLHLDLHLLPAFLDSGFFFLRDLAIFIILLYFEQWSHFIILMKRLVSFPKDNTRVIGAIWWLPI